MAKNGLQTFGSYSDVQRLKEVKSAPVYDQTASMPVDPKPFAVSELSSKSQVQESLHFTFTFMYLCYIILLIMQSTFYTHLHVNTMTIFSQSVPNTTLSTQIAIGVQTQTEAFTRTAAKTISVSSIFIV